MYLARAGASSEVHDFLSVSMHLNSSSHCSWRPIITGTTLVRPFSTIMFFLNQMIPCTESNKMGVIRWSWNGYTSSATNVSVTQLICQALQFISVEMVVVP